MLKIFKGIKGISLFIFAQVVSAVIFLVFIEPLILHESTFGKIVVSVVVFAVVFLFIFMLIYLYVRNKKV